MAVYLLDEVAEDIVGQEQAAASEAQATALRPLEEAQVERAPKLGGEYGFQVALVPIRHFFEVDPLIQTQPQHQCFPHHRAALQPLAGLRRAAAAVDSFSVDACAGSVRPALAVDERGGADPKSQVR